MVPGLVEATVVPAAQEHEVRQVGPAAALPRAHVMPVAPGRRPVATGPAAVLVAQVERVAQRVGDRAGRPAPVENLRSALDDHPVQRRVAQVEPEVARRDLGSSVAKRSWCRSPTWATITSTCADDSVPSAHAAAVTGSRPTALATRAHRAASAGARSASARSHAFIDVAESRSHRRPASTSAMHSARQASSRSRSRNASASTRASTGSSSSSIARANPATACMTVIVHTFASPPQHRTA